MKVYTFWEPKHRVIPYLELCRETWTRNLGRYEVVTLDYSNLHDYISPTLLDLDILKRVPLAMQKDVIMIALLHEHGGVFLDMDTIAVADIRPLIRMLDKHEVVMLGTHYAFMAARPKARLLAHMMEVNKIKLSAVQAQSHSEGPIPLPWDFFGNSVLAGAKAALTRRTKLWRLPHYIPIQKARSAAERFAFATELRSVLVMLDREDYGFIAESGYARATDPRRTYPRVLVRGRPRTRRRASRGAAHRRVAPLLDPGLVLQT